MLDRFERPLKILCLGLALLLAWQLAGLLLRRDPLSRLKIPALPALPAATNEPVKPNTVDVKTSGTNGTNAAHGPTPAHDTNAMAKPTNALSAAGANTGSGSPGGDLPGGRGSAGVKKIQLPPDVQARVDKIIDSEILGPAIRPTPMALVGIADQEAFIRATNGQTSTVKLGGEMGGIKLLRIGINRVLVEQDGEKKELTLFGGMGGESLMPMPTNAPSTNAPSTNMPSTNAPSRKPSTRNAAAGDASVNQHLLSRQKENP
jgi:hypothetical protein